MEKNNETLKRPIALANFLLELSKKKRKREDKEREREKTAILEKKDRILHILQGLKR